MQDSCMQHSCGVLLLLLKWKIWVFLPPQLQWKSMGTKGMPIIIVDKYDFLFRNLVTLLLRQPCDVDLSQLNLEYLMTKLSLD